MRSFVVAGVIAAGVAGPAFGADPAAAAPSSQSSTATSTGTATPSTATSTSAATPADEEARKKLEADIAKELGASETASAPAAQQPAQPAQASGAAQGSGGIGSAAIARVLLLPDISAIGSFALAYDRYDVPRLSPRDGPYGPTNEVQPLFQELELGLQSVVDPYARADVFISFTPDGVDVEEAYLTTLSLPAGLQLRAGKFFSPFGRLNQQHPHVWDFVDAPLAARLVATEKLSGPGVDLAWLAPLPWFAELHLAYQATAPAPSDPERPTGVALLQQYFSIGDATTLGVGASAAVQKEATGGGSRDLGNVSVYLRVRPPTTRAYVTLQGELYGRRFRGEPGGSDGGGYAQLFWRPGPFWGCGIRYDDAPAVPEAGVGRDRRYGALANWYPSEFSRLRVQLSYDQRPNGGDGLEALLALEFVIGSHGAHPF